jgi:hypothetical protein
MVKQQILVAGVMAGLVIASPVRATVIGYDDLPSFLVSSVPVPDGYAGLNWQNVYVLAGTDLPGTGFQNGVVSPLNAGYGGFSLAAGFSAISGVFTLDSAYFTAGYAAETVTVTGYVNGIQVDTQSFAVNTTAPQLETFGWSGLTSVSFVGDTYFAHVVIDDLSVSGLTAAVPEISTWTMMLAGFAGLGFAGYGRKKAALAA